jgi:hypothetical protein
MCAGLIWCFAMASSGVSQWLALQIILSPLCSSRWLYTKPFACMACLISRLIYQKRNPCNVNRLQRKGGLLARGLTEKQYFASSLDSMVVKLVLVYSSLLMLVGRFSDWLVGNRLTV